MPLGQVPEAVQRLLDGSVDAAVIVDQQHRVLYRNAAYEAYTGRKPRALRLAVEADTPCYDLFPLEICREQCLMKSAVANKKPLRMDEVRARRGDGEEVTLIVTATPLEGGLTIETYRDVTAEARVQRRYHALMAREQHAKEKLERAVEARTRELSRAHEQLALNEKLSSLGRLVAGIAHELNNPINFVYGNVDFLGDYFRQLLKLVDIYESSLSLPEEVRAVADVYKSEIDYDFLRRDWERLLRSVRAGAERTAAIVTDLKTFSRPQVGNLEDVDLVAGLETTLNLLAPLLRDGVSVERDFWPLPLVRCRGGQVQQVLMNLLTNAVQACGAAGVVRVAVSSDGAGVRLTVRDSGPGVPDEVRGHIFDPFFTTKDVGEGTGLGLAISSRIVKAHGGRLELVSPPGEGAEFLVWLPLLPPPDA